MVASWRLAWVWSALSFAGFVCAQSGARTGFTPTDSVQLLRFDPKLDVVDKLNVPLSLPHPFVSIMAGSSTASSNRSSNSSNNSSSNSSSVSEDIITAPKEKALGTALFIRALDEDQNTICVENHQKPHQQRPAGGMYVQSHSTSRDTQTAKKPPPLCFGSLCERVRSWRVRRAAWKRGRAGTSETPLKDGSSVTAPIGALRVFVRGVAPTRGDGRDGRGENCGHQMNGEHQSTPCGQRGGQIRLTAELHGFTVESGFPTIVPSSGAVVRWGRRYYELQIERGCSFQLGWVRPNYYFGDGVYTGVGDDSGSWGFDGHRRAKWHFERQTPYGDYWKPGDVIGVAVDVDKGHMWYSINGRYLGVAFRDIFVGSDGLLPAVTVEGDDGSLPAARFRFTDPIFKPSDYETVAAVDGAQDAALGVPASDFHRQFATVRVRRSETAQARTALAKKATFELFGSVRQVSAHRIHFLPNGKWAKARTEAPLKPLAANSQRAEGSLAYFEVRFQTRSSQEIERVKRTSSQEHFSVGLSARDGHVPTQAFYTHSKASVNSSTGTTRTGRRARHKRARVAASVGFREHEPGFDGHSFAYYSDGHRYWGFGERDLVDSGSTWHDETVTVGLGVDMDAGHIFLTRNGRYLGVAWDSVPYRKWHAVVSFRGCEAFASFERDNFLFNVSAYLLAQSESRFIFDYVDVDRNGHLSRREYSSLAHLVAPHSESTRRDPLPLSVWRGLLARETVSEAGAEVSFGVFLEGYRRMASGRVVFDRVVRTHEWVMSETAPIFRHFDDNADDAFSAAEFARLRWTIDAVSELRGNGGWLCGDVLTVDWEALCASLGLGSQVATVGIDRIVLACAQGVGRGYGDADAIWKGFSSLRNRVNVPRKPQQITIR